MKTQQKYPGLNNGSYAALAVDIVVEAKSITGPVLAARLGITPYEMGNIKRALALGYIHKAKSDQPADGNTNVYTVGEQLPKAGEVAKSLAQVLLEHIAAQGAMTSLALAEKTGFSPSAVTSCLLHYTKKNVVKSRHVSAQGKAKSLINEYFDANLQRYHDQHVRSGTRVVNSPDVPAPQNLVPPRTAPAFRPLNLARLGVIPQREGAWDFKDIPSHYARNACA